MRVIRAATAGFCMGVGLALKKLEAAVDSNPGPIRTLGPIIHNPQALAAFEARGVRVIDGVDGARPHDHVLIRAHGVPRQTEAELRVKCASVEDATCPKVKKAQLAIAGATAAGQTLLLFGEADHPEVAGLLSYARGQAHVFGSAHELERLGFDAGRGIALASQTTQDRAAFEEIAAGLGARHPGLVVLRTICDATRQRQDEALAIAAQVEAMVVVGGRQSGNTRRLAHLAQGAGIETFLVEQAGELEPERFAGRGTVGLTAGASTPGDLIDAVEAWLLAL